MQVTMIDGQVHLTTNKSDDWHHRNNPLHFFSRLIKAGVEKEMARALTRDYEEVFKLALRQLN